MPVSPWQRHLRPVAAPPHRPVSIQLLGNAFGKDEGFVVDTHVGRLARRLGFTRQVDPVKVENDLNAIVPKGRRTLAAHLLIFHGRRICTARKPACPECPVLDLCPRIGVESVRKGTPA